MKVTDKLVNYIINAKFDKIPVEAVSKTKSFILDEIGNCLGGSRLKSGKLIIEWGKLFKGTPEATIYADGTKVPIAIASGVNTQLCMGLELMETYRNRCHPGSGMVMTALALSEKEKIGGKDIINAVCAAYDVTGRIIDATWPSREHQTFVWNQPWQGCGPLVVSIKLLKLDFEQGMHAFGMGLGNGPTMNVHNIIFVPASMSKCGNQFHNFVAVNAAILAKMGYTGYHEILDEPYAFWTLISNAERREVYTLNLGKEYYINSGMSFKPWPTCRWAQPGIQSLIEIINTENLNADDIKEIRFRSHEKITTYPYDNINPDNPEDAYWSVPWAFACAALGFKIGYEWYAESNFDNVRFKDLMKKVKIETLQEAVEAFEKEPLKSISILEITDKNNKVYRVKTDQCKGDPDQPMTYNELIEKFNAQAADVIPQQKAKRIIELIEDLDNIEDVSVISDLVY
jgi:2-methylcitrate dehydratase PrpD